MERRKKEKRGGGGGGGNYVYHVPVWDIHGIDQRGDHLNCSQQGVVEEIMGVEEVSMPSRQNGDGEGSSDDGGSNTIPVDTVIRVEKKEGHAAELLLNLLSYLTPSISSTDSNIQSPPPASH